MTNDKNNIIDLFIIGGGINGVGIAADASGRGLSVTLCEQNDLASATSSASSKLIHGGLRYLEHYEFRLVREALAEREVLLKKCPHLIKPMRFVLPHLPHLRPKLMIRAGLFLYDHLARRGTLPGTKTIRIKPKHPKNPLKKTIRYGFEYSDCQVDDSRLVISNALQANALGATILTRSRCTQAVRKKGLWYITVVNDKTSTSRQFIAKSLINAAGPWVQSFIETALKQETSLTVRLIKGSHIVVPKMYVDDKAYILQNDDQRIIFVIPYQEAFTLIGTTDKEYHGAPERVSLDDEEKSYLLASVNHYFKKQLSANDIVWDYSGVRPLHGNEDESPSAITRDYSLVLQTDTENKAPLLTIYGGKITTYRKLAEAALHRLETFFPTMSPPWTENSPLFGGDIGNISFEKWAKKILSAYAWLNPKLGHRLINSYGTCIHTLLDGIHCMDDMGTCFGGNLYQAEVDYLIEKEWAQTVEDIIWRRSKCGLLLNRTQQAALSAYLISAVTYLQEKET